MYWTVIFGFPRNVVTVNSVEAVLLADVDALDRQRLGRPETMYRRALSWRPTREST